MKKIALFLIAFMTFSPLVNCIAETERSAVINSPGVGEEVYGEVTFSATLIDDDEDGVSWAVREGTCEMGIGTVLGNVDGHNDDYSWFNGEFSVTADTTGWNRGEYCFIFNPTEDAGETDIRLTREFVIVDEPEEDIIDPEVEILEPNDGSTIAEIVNIHGLVNDENLERYALVIKDSSDVEILNNETVDSDSFADKILYSWDTTTVSNGTYIITLTAEDESDNIASDSISIDVDNYQEDVTAPEVEILEPNDGSTIAEIVNIHGSVEDENLEKYTLTIVRSSDSSLVKTIVNSDGASFINELLYSWDTATVSNGVYVVTLIAEDSAENVSSDSVSVEVKNTEEEDDDNPGEENRNNLQNKNQCKNGGWMNFGFKNQGSCVSYIQSNDHAGKRQ